MAQIYATVCGLRVLMKNPTRYGGGHIYSGAVDIGTHAEIGKKTATKLAQAFSATGKARPPRPGFEVQLCDRVWLINRGGRFEVDRRASGGLRGRGR